MANILGINIDNISKIEVLRKINEYLTNGLQHWIVTVNPEIALKARKDEKYKNILNEADLRVADGTGIVMASWLSGEKIKERITGVDLVYAILKNIKPDLKIRVMFIGGDSDSRRKVVGKTRNIFPNINFAASIYDINVNEVDKDLSLKVNKEIKDFHANILFVALGAPYQEKWIYENLPILPSVKLAVGIGGAIDMISGKLQRAPYFMRKIGFEWLWRLFLEPGRVYRIFNAVVVFPCLIIASFFRRSKNSRFK